MNASNFARRQGYQEERLDFKQPDYLPRDIRQRIGMMMVEYFESLPLSTELAQSRFAHLILDTFPNSHDLWEWDEGLRGAFERPDGNIFGRKKIYDHLIDPLKRCDWRLVYQVVENFVATLEAAGYPQESDFVPVFNLLLDSHRIPWIFASGRVIPAADSEFADELKHAQEVAHPLIADDGHDPHALIRDALDALYRKQGGPDLESANLHAWAAWKVAAGEASGFGSRDRRTFEYIKAKHPKIASTMQVWQQTAEGGRHPEDGQPLTEDETRFIVMLCVNAVRSLCPTCNPV